MYFAKHETFHIRDGWLTKGLRTLQQDQRIFFDPEAPEKLGMGKNMVRSLRFWMQATGLTEEVRSDALTVQKPTLLGQLIHDNDPYLGTRSIALAHPLQSRLQPRFSHRLALFLQSLYPE